MIAGAVLVLALAAGYAIAESRNRSEQHADTGLARQEDTSRAALAKVVYNSQSALRDANVKSCKRGVADRKDNARAWLAAAHTSSRLATLDRTAADRRVDLRGAKRYRNTARGLKSRIVNCEKVLPAPTKPVEVVP